MNKDTDDLTAKKICDFTDLRDRDVLEIGCGDGRITRALSGIPGRLVGIDPDPDAIRKAIADVDGVRFDVGAGERLDFPDGSFDVVLFTLSLHHQNSEKALKEADRVLRTGGCIIVLEPVAGSEIERVCRPFQKESGACLNALYAVMGSEFAIEKREIFDAFWRFQDRDELHEWAFAYYKTPFDPNIAAEMDRVLDDKAANAPLLIQDRLLLVSLRK